jgi:hypothetical protein
VAQVKSTEATELCEVGKLQAIEFCKVNKLWVDADPTGVYNSSFERRRRPDVRKNKNLVDQRTKVRNHAISCKHCWALPCKKLFYIAV